MAKLTWAPYRLFPYEERLAASEVEVLTGSSPMPTSDGFEVSDESAQRLAERATYFDSVQVADSEITTAQAAVEATHALARGVDRHRQATRYGLHGVHEYKGKFNPQVVRALTNVIDVEADVLVDPFCGSGTSLIEAARLGMQGVGVDRSPMAVFISSGKAAALGEPDLPATREAFADFVHSVAGAMKEAQQTCAVPDLAGVLTPEAQAYLRAWFPEESFAAVAAALAATAGARPRSIVHHLAEIGLSSILRAVSLQLPEDLRIRRRPEPFSPPPVWELFLQVGERIEAGLEEMESWPTSLGRVDVHLGSASDPSWFDRCEGGRRLVLTSPPYATALPYIDTDRLSIVALGLAPVGDVRSLEMELLGSREWRKADERAWNERFHANADRLPSVVTSLSQNIERRNSEGGAGFRRAAVPALLYRYFASMGTCFDAWRSGLRRGEFAVLIVGYNRTTSGGEQVLIRTPEILGEVAASRGYEVERVLPLETWPRYGLHAKNGVNGEAAVVVRRS